MSLSTHGRCGAWVLLVLSGCGPSIAKLKPEADVVGIYGEGGGTVVVTPLDAAGNVVSSSNLKWHSSAPQVAVVQEQGVRRRADGAIVAHVVVGQSGVAWLTAQAGGVAADIRVTVGIPTAVSTDPPQVKLTGLGQSERVQVWVKDDFGQPVTGVPTWYRMVEAGTGAAGGTPVNVSFSVDGGLLVTATAFGQCGLMVLAGPVGPDGGEDPPGTLRTVVPITAAPIDVAPPKTAQSSLGPVIMPLPPALTLSPASALLKVNQSVIFRAQASGAVGKAKTKVIWKSTAPKVVSINPHGKAKARKRGKAEIIAIVGRASARAEITVH